MKVPGGIYGNLEIPINGAFATSYDNLFQYGTTRTLKACWCRRSLQHNMVFFGQSVLSRSLNTYIHTYIQHSERLGGRGYFSLTHYPANCRIQDFKLTAEEVHRQLTHPNTNKNKGADEIHPETLSSLAYCLALSLEKPFNNSFATGIISVELKSSKTCPIYKKGSKYDAANNRSICLNSVACKIVERIAKANILHYLKTASLLSDALHGFMPRRLHLINFASTDHSRRVN